MNRNNSVILTFLFFLCSSCSQDPLQYPKPDKQEQTFVEVAVQPSTMECITRTTDEKAIDNLNYYLVDIAGETVLHHYSQESNTLRFSCIPGRYTLYVVANVHRDMGILSLAGLRAYRIEHSDAYETLPMAGHAEVDIEHAEGFVTLPPITVSRHVARIDYSIHVAEAMQGTLRLQSVRHVSLPSYGTPFSEALPVSFFSEKEIPITADEYHFSASFYMFPNEQGTIPEITIEQERGKDVAPENASGLLIHATINNSRIVSYLVYLGENNTDNFDVRRNNIQMIDITIRGTNEVDTRVDSYLLLHSFTPVRLGSYCIPGSYPGMMMLRGGRTDLKVQGQYSLLEGDAASAVFRLGDVYNISSFEMPRSRQVNYTFTYMPAVITPENRFTHHRLAFTDDREHTTTYDVRLQWANRLSVFSQTGGSIETAQALAENKDGRYTHVACIEPCTLRAVPDNSYVFDGWYEDAAHTKRLSSDMEYRYMPQTAQKTLYARFETDYVLLHTDIDTVTLQCNRDYTIDREHHAFRIPRGSECTLTGKYPTFIDAWYDAYDVSNRKYLGNGGSHTLTVTENCTVVPQFKTDIQLDKNGTANCYVVHEMYALYSFDATVMGNGKTTKNIAPRSLAGTSAITIWHMGSSSMIYELALHRERIYFTTRPLNQENNAGIGLLDAGGNLIWSWHIWRTRGEDDAGITYADGRVLMHRNLGASSDLTSQGEGLVTGFGFYYQWGRKDPFVYPKRYCDTQQSSDIRYAAGYEFSEPDDATGTVEWAVAHPTAFINGAENWPDWLRSPRKNLWGNPATTVYDTGLRSSKTIYDPCPPGWKVPDEDAWTDAAINISSFLGTGYMYLKCSGAVSSYYPVGGYYYNGQFNRIKTTACYWTDSPARIGGNGGTDFYTSGSCAMIVDKNGMSRKYGNLRRDAAAMVRCMKEK